MSNPTGDIPRSIRGHVLALIRDRGPMPRAELARQLALSATTITRTVNELEAGKLLVRGAMRRRMRKRTGKRTGKRTRRRVRGRRR